MIRVSLLTDKLTHDSEVVEELLNQIDTLAERYIGDGAYDTKGVYELIEKRNLNTKIDNAVGSDLWYLE